MFFTQDDYKKIQQWLIKNSVKDTEFNEATIPFNGNEIVSIVQGNQNKKVFLKDLIAQVFNLGISDFVNITDKYDAPNTSLEEAIRLIPSRARKEGQVITFLDKEDHWHIYQFKGALNQWNVLDTWEDLFDWEKLIIDSILPDEEDLTKSPADENGNSYLSLKDRAYNPKDFSGLGRVILRKNIVEVEDPIYSKVKNNILTQGMFTQSNTIYEIRYDFDLNGQEITIPEGCVLNFLGGSLSNGTIEGNNTTINSRPVRIFYNITIKFGSWNVNNAYSEWFDSIQTALDNFPYIKLLPKKYDIYKGILLRSGNCLYGTKGTELNFIVQGENCIKLANNSKIKDFMVNLEDNDSTAVLIDGEYFTESINDNPNRFNISNSYAASRTYMIEGVEFWHRVGDISNIGSTVVKVLANNGKGYYGKIMRNCLAIGYWDCGILIDNGGDNVHSDGWLTDLKFSDIIMSTCRVGVKITKSVSVSENHEPARNIYFDCISYQSYAKNKVEEYDARAAILDSGWNIYFNNLNIWDWDPTSVKDRTPILINPNKCRNIVIDNGNSNIYYKRIYTFSEDYVYNNNKVGVNLILKDYMKSSYDISHFIDTTVENFDYKQFVTLPDGIYTLSDTLLSKIGLDSFTSGTVYVKKEIMVGSALMLTAFSTKKTYEGLPNSIAYCVFYLNSIGSIDSNAWNIIGNIAGKNKSKNNIYLDSSNYNKVVIRHNNSEIYADGSAVGSKEVGTYAERPKSPRIGYMYFCTDKNIETSTKGSPIYYVGGGQWADITGKILPFEDYIS